MQHLTIYLAAWALGALGAWIISNIGGQIGLIDYPNERSSHHRPTIKGGGIGILASFVFVSLLIDIPLRLWLPAVILAAFSLLGDRLHFSPKLRLVVQFAAAIALLTGLPRYLGGFTEYLTLIPPAVFIVGTANFYNFMDGINGMAAIAGIVGFGLLGYYIYLGDGNSRYFVLSICIAISCLGFLPFNMPKAKVFMGDVSSILLGFVFAGLTYLESKNVLDFLCIVSFMFPFYADELITMIERLRDGESLIEPHRRHYYQLMANEKGIAHWKVSAGYGAFQLVVGISVLLARSYGLLAVLAMLMGWSVAFWMENRRVRFQS